VLQVFTDTTGRTVRPSDVFGRIGGEEFAAVFYDIGRERALLMAEDIRARFAEAASLVEGRPINATVSIGMVLSDDAVLDVPKLLRHADQALYRAKERGRNRVEIATADRSGKPGGMAPPSSNYAADAA
jgi:diguanylate cyclase (GGDEF)-like protein